MREPGVVVRFPELPEGAVLRRRRGRPRTLGLEPTIDQAAYEAEVAKLRDEHVEADPLVATSRSQDGPRMTLDLLMDGLAQEQAAIGFEARKAERQQREDVARTISRRVDALLRLAGLVLERERLRREQGAISPQGIATVRRMFFEVVAEAARETLPEAAADALLIRVEARVQENESRGSPRSVPRSP